MSEQRSPRVGIIGLGSIGRLHLATWQAIAAEVVALSDTIPDVLAAAAKEIDATPFADGLDLVRDGSVDIVSICTPPKFHRPLAVAAAEAGVAALCEKPLAHSVEDAEAIAAAVDASGGAFTVGFCHRYEPAIEEIRRMIEAGELGTIMTIRNRFAGHMVDAEKTWFASPEISGGGALADTTIHSIEMFRYLAGDAVRVTALTSTQECDLGPALDVEDTGVILLQNADGVIGVLEASWRTPPGEWAITVYGTKGSATYDYSTGELRVHLAAEDAPRRIDLEPGDRFQREFAHFIDVWRGTADPRVTVHDGVAANRILAEAYQSAGSEIDIGAGIRRLPALTGRRA